MSSLFLVVYITHLYIYPNITSQSNINLLRVFKAIELELARDGDKTERPFLMHSMLQCSGCLVFSWSSLLNRLECLNICHMCKIHMKYYDVTWMTWMTVLHSHACSCKPLQAQSTMAQASHLFTEMNSASFLHHT